MRSAEKHYMPHGFDQLTWDAAKAEARAILIARARVRGMIAYSELCASIQRIKFVPRSAAFSALLVEISSEEANAGRGMLSALVIHKNGKLGPGAGFYEMAASLGRDPRNALECWLGELQRVHKYWVSRGDSSDVRG